MIWLWILLGIFLFLAILFLLPLSIRIGYGDEVALSAGLPGLYFSILPKKKKTPNLRRFSAKKYRKLLEKDRLAAEKKAKKEREKALRKKQSTKEKESERKKRLPPTEKSDEPSIISRILPVICPVLDTFGSRLRVKICRMHITVGGSDAAQIAMTYGVIAQGVSYLLELPSQKTKFRRARDADIDVRADFLLAKTTADVEIIFRLRLLDLLAVGIKFLFLFLSQKGESTHTPEKSNQRGVS